ncbi:rab GTPase-binding effector protein 2 [Dunckerocampus dactyliophorus]|uniref:rab GTPase-binding effector protein 2 n=1 Tax=Dunckerocampus dactyliophorus TaxID=161453 RepID=UPI002406A0E4|nr:rab GTPase-binding effector protein 2 [Dunckerocampus dactyliophorus]XP_054616039.1 rab GTPase-binding effector protein 2 [Dunckerocampus dactyliophorus]
MELSDERMSSSKEDTEVSLQAQLAESQAQVEHWQGVATICELSKREELAELQKQCDQEIQSLQEALRETASQYEARIAVLLEGRRASGHNQGSGRKGKMDAEVTSNDSQTSPERLHSQPADPEPVVDGEAAQHNTEGYFSLRNCDSASLSSFSIDTPSLPRKAHAQEDTDSLVSTGTLVPEAIYLPPAGHRLVTHNDWDALNAQVSELRGEVSRLVAEKEELEKELETQTNHTHKQVSVLQSQVQSSEALLQDLQKSLSQSQTAVQSRLSALSLSQRKVCSELSKLKGENVEDDSPDFSSLPPASLQAAHCEERLRIEIVNLREHIDMRAEENEILEVQLSSLKTETERIQAQKDQLQAELLACRTEVEALRLALSHVQGNNKVLNNDKAALQQKCLELRSQVISLRSQVDTSQTVQRDFVQLSQSLQVKLELIRQAESLEQVRKILEEGISEDDSPPADAS